MSVQTIVRRNPLEARVLAACRALIRRKVYPSVREICRQMGGGREEAVAQARRGREEAVAQARRRLVESGRLELPERQRPEARYGLAGRTPAEIREVAAGVRRTRLEWARDGKLLTPLRIVNPGPYRLEDCRGRLVTHLILRDARRSSRG